MNYYKNTNIFCSAQLLYICTNIKIQANNNIVLYMSTEWLYKLTIKSQVYPMGNNNLN